MSKNVIHAGGVFLNPMLNREGKAAFSFMPGTICVFENGQIKPCVDAADEAIKYIANYDYLRCKSVKDEFEEGDWVIGMHPTSGAFFNVLAIAGNYKKGDPLKIDNGRLIGGGDESSQFFAEETITIATTGDLIRVVVK